MIVIGFLTAVIGLVSIYLKYLSSPAAAEKERQKKKAEVDDALRKGDLEKLSSLLSDERDRLAGRVSSKNSNNP